MAQLARIYPVSCGTYVYVGKQLHPVVGFMAGWICKCTLNVRHKI